MRSLTIAAFVLSLSPGAAIADDDTYKPITYHVPGVTTVVQKHSQPIGLRRHPKITWVRPAFTYDCLAANCLVIAALDVLNQGDGFGACVYVDGKPMKPTCTPVGQSNLQAKLVSQGTHSFQTGVQNSSDMKSSTCPCITTYTIYDSGN